MKQFPSIPRVENAPPELFESGHLWIQEKVDGANFRFRLLDSGMFEFGDRSRAYDAPERRSASGRTRSDDADEIPEPYRHAVRHVRERVDRAALRNAVADVESVVFFGEAMHRHAVDYDWDRTPSFLGFDVWNADERRFLPPDVVEQVYDRLGLAAVDAVEKEVRAVDFDPEAYEIPASAWYDGPAEGVVLRSKTGLRAKLLHPEFREVDDAVPVEAPAEELAEKYVTRHRVEKVVHKLEDRERRVTFDAVFDRVVEDVVREEHKQLFHGNRSVDVTAFRSTVAERTKQFLDERTR